MKALDAHLQADRAATVWPLSLLLIALGLIPLRLFLWRFIESDFLALAVEVPDDSFYYLLPAWRFVTHGYFTFDGLHKTYGFQPLYMLLLTLLSATLPSIEAVFRAALCINATLHVATGVLVGLAVNALLPGGSTAVRYIASLLASAVYLLGWNLFWANVTLKENPLAAFLYVFSILCLLRALSAPRERSIGSDVGLGTLLGLLLLARLLPSSVLAAGVMLVVVAAFLARRSAIIIGAAMLVPLLLWSAYAKLSFGHALPTSARVKIGGEGVLGAVGYWWALGPDQLYAWVGWYVGWVFYFLCDMEVGQLRFFTRVGFLAVGLSGLALSMALAAWWSRGRTLVVLLAAAAVGGILAIPLLLYTSTKPLLTYSAWYLFEISAIFSIVCAAALGFLGQRGVARLSARWLRPRPAVAAIGIGLIWLGAALAETRWFKDVRPMARWDIHAEHDSDSKWKRAVVDAALRFRAAVPLEEGDRVGAFNAGLIGLLLLPTGVINLDGLANDDITGEYLGHVGAWPSPTLAEYISRERIRYVIDYIPPWTDWERVVGLKTELVLKTEAQHPFTTHCSTCDGLTYYVVRFPQTAPNPPAAGHHGRPRPQ